MSEEEYFSEGVDEIDIVIDPTNKKKDEFEHFWLETSFAGQEEDEVSSRVNLTEMNYEDMESNENEDTHIVGIDEKWETHAGVHAGISKKEISKVLDEHKSKMAWKVVGMPNSRPSQNQIVPPSGFALGVDSAISKAPILIELINPDKLAYGLKALKIPFPDESKGSTKEIYEMSKEQIMKNIDEIKFSDDLEMQFSSSFVGIYEEWQDCHDYYRRALWVIIQDGDKDMSMDFYDRIERVKTENAIKTWKQLIEEGAELMKKAKERLAKQMTLIMSQFHLEYKNIRDGSIEINQMAHSFFSTQDGAYYAYYSGCFPVINEKYILLGVSPCKGFWLISDEEGESFSMTQVSMQAFPYGTGADPNREDLFSTPSNVCVYGNKNRAFSKRFNDRTLNFRIQEERLGRMKKHRNSLLVPYVVKIHEMEEKEIECVWK